MKKKTILGVTALTGLLLLAATGCEKTQQPPVKTPTQNQTGPTGSTEYVTPNLGGKKLNVYLNYKAYAGVSFVGTKMTTYTNPIDGQTYVEKDLLPMWKQIQTDLNCEIHDAVYDFKSDSYTQNSDDNVYKVLNGDSNFGQIDLFMTNSASAPKFNANGQLVNLYDYLDYMPNFKKFLVEHPTVASEMTNSAGQLYMLPYFDGLDAPEKMFLMNTELVEWLLDDEAKLAGEYDNTTAKETAYKAFIDTSKDQKVLISVKGKAEEITIKAAKNPITAQNELTTKNGKNYVQALKDYIDTAYMPSGKYAKRSEVFTAEHACYTVDDMIALMRCAVNNSVYLYGTANKVQGLIPRQREKSRVDSILYFAQAWGVRGLTSEKEYMYFDNNGKLQDARIQQSTYDALGYLHDLYAEGLIIDGFTAKEDKYSYSTNFLTGKEGAALLMYDYNATQTVNNKVDENGIGTSSSLYNGVMPVLPPLTKWAEDNINGTAAGGKGYELTRYTEDARSNKGSGTVIPTYEGKDEAQIIAACQLADYFYSPEGADLQDFGPKGVNATTGKAYTEGEITVNGIVEPKYSATIINEINTNEAKLGWNDYFRVCVGTTQGIGHVRSDAVDYQVTHTSGQIGLKNLLSAVQSGAVVCAITTRDPGFGAMVPSQWASSPKDGIDKYAALTAFFTRAAAVSGWRDVVVNGWDNAEMSQANLKAVWEDVRNIYLQHYQKLFDN